VQRVRLILVDTPEVHGATECYGAEASAFVEGLLPAGAYVELERDVSETDRFDRLLRYVYLEDGRMLNELLLEQGYAYVVEFPPDTRHLDAFRDLEETARDEGRGRWSACPSDAS
jgi:micrococcal nuclease